MKYINIKYINNISYYDLLFNKIKYIYLPSIYVFNEYKKLYYSDIIINNKINKLKNSDNALYNILTNLNNYIYLSDIHIHYIDII